MKLDAQRIIVVCLICFDIYQHLYSFDSLSEAVQYARTINEFVQPDHANYLNPHFTTFYKEQMHLFTKIRAFFGATSIKYNALVNKTKILLTQMIERYQDPIYACDYIYNIKHEPNDTIFIWSNLQGAFHSLVRGLEELHKMGIINDSLEIIDGKSSIIFDGNVIGASPFNLEILNLVLTMMLKNPDRVFYNKGRYEDRGEWIDRGLLRQINIISKEDSSFTTEMEHIINNFFNRALPDFIFLDYPTPSGVHQLVRIEGIELRAITIQDNLFGDFFSKPFPPNSRVTLYCIKDQKATTKPIRLSVVIKTYKGFLDYEPTHGLHETLPEGGAQTWAIFSSPILYHQKINNFYYDAFVRLTLTDSLTDAIIDLFNRDIREKKGFEKVVSYNLLTGAFARFATDVDQNQVIIGANLDLSESAGVIGVSLCTGAMAALHRAHERMDASVRFLRFIYLDDYSIPDQSLQNIRLLQDEYDTSISCFTIGDAMLAGYIDQIKRGSLLVVFSLIASSEYRSPEYKGLILLRPTSEKEVETMLRHAYKHASGKKWSFFFQNDDWGLSYMKAAREWMKKAGIDNWNEFPYMRNVMKFGDIINKMKQEPSNALFCFSTTLPTKELFLQIGIDTLFRIYNTDIYGCSLLSGGTFETFCNTIGLNPKIAVVFPDPYSNLEIAQEYRAQMDKMNIAYEVISLSGYIATSILIDAIQHIKGPVNAETLGAYLSALKNYTFKGLTLTFDSQLRTLNNNVWLRINGVWHTIAKSGDAIKVDW